MVSQPDKTWKKADLIEYAKTQGISLTKDMKKEEILKAIKKTPEAELKSQPTPPEKKLQPRKKKEEEKKEETQIVEKGEYTPKQKPEISQETKQKLLQRETKKHVFHRQEWFRYKRLGDRWRRPRGRHSKMRLNRKYRPPKVRIGHRNPKDIRGLHPSGFEEILIHNTYELEKINPKTQAARIAGAVGEKKRAKIEEKANEKGIRILNRRKQ